MKFEKIKKIFDKNNLFIQKDIFEKRTIVNDTFINTEGIKKLICVISYFLLGVSCGIFPEKYEISPFAVSLLAVCKQKYTSLVFFGSFLGYLLSRSFSSSVIYLILICFVTAGKTVIERNFDESKHTFYSCIMACGFVLVFGAVSLAVDNNKSLVPALIKLCEFTVCLCYCYFIKRVLSLRLVKKRFDTIGLIDKISVLMCITAISFSLESVTLGKIHPYHFLASVIILCFSFYFGMNASCTIGVILGFVLSIESGNNNVFYTFSLGGLFSGMLSALGQYAIPVIFSGVSVFVFLLKGGNTGDLYLLAECIGSSLMFLAIPPKTLNRVMEYFEKSCGIADKGTNNIVSKKLKTASKSIRNIPKQMENESKSTDVPVPEMSRIYASVQRNVCSACSSNSSCWNNSFNDTVNFIHTLTEQRLTFCEAAKEMLDFPCIEYKSILTEIDKTCNKFLSDEDYRIKQTELKEVFREQFVTVSKLIDDISDSIICENNTDEAKSRAIKTALNEKGIGTQSVVYYTNSESCSFVEVKLYDIDYSDAFAEKIKSIIEKTTEKKYHSPKKTDNQVQLELKFTEKQAFKVKLGFAQIPLCDNNVCGDCVEYFDIDKGVFWAMICDGMGTGTRAEHDSRVTARLMKSLISGSISFSCSIDFVNSALLINNSEESLSTIDAIEFNRYTGVCGFYKAGASYSFIRRGNEIIKIEKSSLPIGILSNISYAKEEIKLCPNDIVVMVSDGVGDSQNTWLYDTILSWSTDSMDELSAYIASMAQMKNKNSNPDDISVIAVKIKKII